MSIGERRMRKKSAVIGCVEIIFLIFVSAVIVTLLKPSFDRHDERQRTQEFNNLRNVAIALQNYATRARGDLPLHKSRIPPNNVPMSWRVATLPYIDSQGLYAQWNQQQPWDSPANATVAAAQFECLQHSSDNSKTNVVVITGPQTCFPDDQAANLGFIPDGASQTILLIQYPYKDIHWAQPKDLTLDEAMELYSKPTLPFDYSTPSFWGGKRESDIVNVVFADGSARVMPLGLSKETLRALFTASGGEKLKGDEF